MDKYYVTTEGLMRLIRSGFGPANFSGQFGGHRVTKTSNACLNPVSTDTSNVGPGSNIQWRGRSYTASVPSDTPEVKKARRRVPKDERKSMVENYVNKYRTMNAGKFPTATDAKKDVGGSYYVVRQIIQELKYNSKMPSLDTMDATSVEKGTMKKDKSIDLEEVYQTRESGQIINHSKPSVDVLVSSSESRLEVDICEDGQTSIDTMIRTKVDKENKILTAGVDLLSSQTKEDLVNYHDVQINSVYSKNKEDKEKSLTQVEELLSNHAIVDEPTSKQLTYDSIFTNFESKEWPKSLNSVESDESKDDGTQFHPRFHESRGSLLSGLENSENNNVRKSTSEDLLKVDELKPTDEKQQSTESEIPGQKLHKIHAEDAETERKSSVWQNLKSFANGIVSLWRRS